MNWGLRMNLRILVPNIDNPSICMPREISTPKYYYFTKMQVCV